jgi:hypothetical protein
VGSTFTNLYRAPLAEPLTQKVQCVTRYFLTHQQLARCSKDKTLQCFWWRAGYDPTSVCLPQTEIQHDEERVPPGRFTARTAPLPPGKRAKSAGRLPGWKRSRDREIREHANPRRVGHALAG